MVVPTVQARRSQPERTPFIPKSCLGHIGFGFLPENDWQTHREARIFSRTVLHGVPWLGFFSSASRR